VILLIDNYDSFVFNLARYLERLGQETLVVRNDKIDAAEVARLIPKAIVVSPGPQTPQQAGCSLEVVRQFSGQIPILGVCLGHQVIAEAFGGQIVRAPEPMHGRASLIAHDEQGIFERLPNPFTACRYHSLIVEETSFPSCLEVSAKTADGIIMAIRHRTHATIGVQFHPESVLTVRGYSILAQFLELAGLLEHEFDIPQLTDEVHVKSAAVYEPPDQPVTF